MSLPICSTCPSETRRRCSDLNKPLHKAVLLSGERKNRPILSEYEKACFMFKHIYVTKGNEWVFYEGGLTESVV